MFKSLIFIVFAFLNISVACAEEKQLPPLNKAYEGIHGMVLMQKGSTVFASHMPSYHKPHDYQILYKLEIRDLNLLQVIRDSRLVTVKPEKFNLHRLVRGEKIEVKADVYIGHFEREGMKVYDDVMLVFDKQLFVRQLTDLTSSSNIQEYSSVQYNRKNDRLYVHHIQKAPSFDHIIHIDLEASCPVKFATSSAAPKEAEILYRLIHCGTMKPLYFETQDFTLH